LAERVTEWIPLLCTILASFFRFTQKDRELAALQKKASDLDARLSELESQLAAANKEKQKWKDEYNVSY